MKSLWLSHMPRGAFPKCQALRHLGDWDTSVWRILEVCWSGSAQWVTAVLSTFVKFSWRVIPKFDFICKKWHGGHWELVKLRVFGRGTKDLRTPINAVGTNDSKYWFYCIYIYTWNPNEPCFERKRPSFGGFQVYTSVLFRNIRGKFGSVGLEISPMSLIWFGHFWRTPRYGNGMGPAFPHCWIYQPLGYPFFIDVARHR